MTPQKHALEKDSFPVLIILWGLFACVLYADWNYGDEFSVIWMIVPLLIWVIFQKRIPLSNAVLMGVFTCISFIAQYFMHDMKIMDFVTGIISRIFLIGIFSWIIYDFRKYQDEMKNLARLDMLTGAVHLPAFMEMLQMEMDRSRRKNLTFTLAYLDCDDFREINEKCGHPEGDALLIMLADTIQTSVRSYDLVGRMGGDEFCILFSETGSDQAQSLMKRVQTELSQRFEDIRPKVTFSIGVVTFYSIPLNSREAVTLADRAMYEVKNSGKNNISYQSKGTAQQSNDPPFDSMENTA